MKQQVDKQEEAAGFQSWYACDGCMSAIPTGQYRYDCEQCDNFSFCERCFKKNTKHVHKFKRIKNSNDLAPPENCDDLIAQSYMLCSNCKDSLLDLNKRVYICKECSPDF